LAEKSWQEESFIVEFDEVELIHFERFSRSANGQIDMVIVFKNYYRRVKKITDIPIQFLDPMEHWLCSHNICYSKSSHSFNWEKIIETVLIKREGFFKNGGWNLLYSTEKNRVPIEPNQEKRDVKLRAKRI